MGLMVGKILLLGHLLVMNGQMNNNLLSQLSL